MTTPLDALKAALEAKREAMALPYTRWAQLQIDDAHHTLHALLTDDTIAALIAVAEAGQILATEPWELSKYDDLTDALAPLTREGGQR